MIYTRKMLESQAWEPRAGKESGTYGIPQPVRRSRQCNATSTNREREDLADDDPGSRTQGRSEEEDEDGDKSDLGINGRNVVCHGTAISELVGVVEANGGTNDPDKELADQHTKRTVYQNRAAAKSLDGVKGDWCGADIDQGEDK